MKVKSPMPTSVSLANGWPDTKLFILQNLFALADHPENLRWQPFRPGIEIHRLYGDGEQGPAAAFLKYAPGASVPAHEHTGYEHILVLSGSQCDHYGEHRAGDLVINPPGSGHAVMSKEGCLVLIIWEKPVSFRETMD